MRVTVADDLDLSAAMGETTRLIAETAHVGNRSCTVEGCARSHHGRGLCKTHYMRQLRTGDPGTAQIVTRPPRQASCTVDGCPRLHQARGLCRTHYSRWHRTGDVAAATPPNPRVCGVPGCQRRHYGRGMCEAHYRRWQQTGQVRPTLNVTECAQLYRDGVSAAGLGRLYGVTPYVVLAALRAAGVQIHPPGRRRRVPNR